MLSTDKHKVMISLNCVRLSQVGNIKHDFNRKLHHLKI